MCIAIVVVAYNRVDSLSRLLNSLNKAIYDESVTLIISVDKSDINDVELFANDYTWPYGDKIVDTHSTNLGLRQHMMSLGKWFERFDAIIVLEDDIVVSPNFFTFARQAVDKYRNCPEIAGISLYSFSINYQTGKPFSPIKVEYDAFFMNCAMSWGEIWMKDSWNLFYNWYLDHLDFPYKPELPKSICSWNQKSWLKYHTRYCIENNKYFVFPYVALTTNYGDAGEHNSGNTKSVYQVEMQQGIKKEYSLPVLDSTAVFYDGFFENKSLYTDLSLDEDQLCLDLNGERGNRLKKDYWLTTEIRDFRIVKSFGLNFRPIELNIKNDNPGNQIYLYDTRIKEKNTCPSNSNALLYKYHIQSLLLLIKDYGVRHLLKELMSYLKPK